MPARASTRRALGLLPVALLVAVAVAQIALARSCGLSPWLGGGFGMFSTTDGWGHRHLHAYAIHAGLRREILLPSSHRGRPAMRAAALPSERHLSALARALVPLAHPADGPLEAIEVQVWSVRHARDTLQPRGVLLRSWRLRLDDGV